MSELRERPNEIAVEDYQLTVERGEQGSVIRLTDSAGVEPLRIVIGPDGPVLFLGSGLAIAVAGDLRFAAERVEIRARDSLEISSGGDAVIRCEGDLLSEAREHKLRARLGDVQVEANDDVKLSGERIRLNC